MPKHLIQVIFLVFLGSISLPLYAGGDCSTATNLSLEPWSTPVYTCATNTTETFTASCAGGGYADTQPGCTSAATCSQQLWFRFDAGDPTQQYDVHFTVTADFSGTGASELRYFVLYSEARDNGNGDPCTWSNPSTEPLTNRYTGTGCVAVPNGIAQFTIEADGMDGDGTYFVLFERVTGLGGNISLCAKSHPTNAPQPAPANDRCTNATAFGLSTGIDAAYLGGGSGLWADAIGGTTQYATKQRRTAECNPGGNTEDHFFTQDFSGCYTNWTIGDQVLFGTAFTKPVDYLENTVYFTATIPADAPGGTDWFLHIGALDCPTTTGTNGIQVLITSTLDCNNAGNTIVDQYDSAFVTGLFPTADLSMGPYTLTAGQTYYIIVDGTRGAGCDFSMLLSPAAINPVLPVEIAAFEAQNEGPLTQLSWTLPQHSDVTHFEVQRSDSPDRFQSIGQVNIDALTPAASYRFVDPATPVGEQFYRIKAIDRDGRQYFSEVRRIDRELQGIEWHAVGPVPMQDELAIHFTAANEGSGTISLLDMAGRTVKRVPLSIQPGVQRHLLAVGALSPGLYILQAQVGASRWTQKVVKR